MICDNCGKSNARGVSKCAYCGFEMPKITESSGFSDILTYKAPEPVEPVAPVGSGAEISDSAERISDIDMRRLFDKLEEIFKNTKFSLIAIGVSILFLVVSIVNSMLMTKKIDSTIADYQTYTDGINTKLNSIVDKLESIETANDDTGNGSQGETETSTLPPAGPMESIKNILGDYNK